MRRTLWALALLSGCGAFNPPQPDAGAVADAGPSCSPDLPTTGDLPADVNAVLQDKCQACHTSPPQNHAPFPLLSYEDTQLPFGITSKRKWQRMAEVVEPNGSPHMPFGDAPQLTDAQLATLRQWFAKCAPPIPEGSGHDLLRDGGAEH